MSEIMEHENYIKLGNIHIFVNFYDYNMEEIEAIKDKKSQEIHIFPTFIDIKGGLLPLEQFIDKYQDTFKINIHMYKADNNKYSFFKRYFDSAKCKVLCEGAGPTFVRDGRIIDVIYTSEGVIISKRITSCSWFNRDEKVPNMKGALLIK